MIMRSVTQLALFAVCIMVLSGTLQGIEPSVQKFDGQKLGCDRNKVREIDFFFVKSDQRKAISVLEDQEGKKFIVKQRVRDNLREHLSVVRETMAVFLAQSVGILANSVEIIPAYYEFPGKRNKSLPATLHTFVPGCNVAELPSDLREFCVDIQQKAKDSIPKNKCGLTREVISNMAKHNDLPLLVGVDTFVGNGDRNRKNIFYDRKSGHYYAIDFESCFEKNVALYAYDNIKVMIEDKSALFSKQEIRGLKTYKDTLVRLIKLYTFEDVYEKFTSYVREAGLMPEETRAGVAAKLLSYKELMKENYESCKQLVVLLDELITTQT